MRIEPIRKISVFLIEDIKKFICELGHIKEVSENLVELFIKYSVKIDEQNSFDISPKKDPIYIVDLATIKLCIDEVSFKFTDAEMITFRALFLTLIDNLIYECGKIIGIKE